MPERSFAQAALLARNRRKAAVVTQNPGGTGKPA
jgi:hypothetical protein